MKLIRTNFYLSADVLTKLRALAKNTERPLVWHVRRAITEYLRKEAPK